MVHAFRVSFDYIGYTIKNKIFRLVKLLADLSTRLSSAGIRKLLYISS